MCAFSLRLFGGLLYWAVVLSNEPDKQAEFLMLALYSLVNHWFTLATKHEENDIKKRSVSSLFVVILMLLGSYMSLCCVIHTSNTKHQYVSCVLHLRDLRPGSNVELRMCRI